MLFLSKIYIMLALGVSTALSLSVNAPTNPESGAQTTITWTSTSSDSTFSIELIHPSFNKALAIANNVDPTLDSITVTLPIVPVQDGYTLQFVNITNINQVFATSPDFAVAPNPSTSAATLSATAGSTTAGSASTPAASLSAGASAGAGSAALSTA